MKVRKRKCKYCNGTGRFFPAFTKEELPCHRCNGTGKEPNPRTLDGHCGGCGADVAHGVKCSCIVVGK